MTHFPRFCFLAMSLLAGGAGLAGPASADDAAASARVSDVAPSDQPTAKRPLDRSGHRRVGKASFYAKKFAGRTMADGTIMHSQGDNAASKTLPLGTKAKVTNLGTGQSAVVTIQDRGPYVKGRIVDLSPSTAEKIGIDRATGVSKVAVTPITVPQSDGTTKAGAAGGSPKQ